MKIVTCLDYSSFTEEVLTTIKSFISSISNPQITVLHIIDQQLFYPVTGYEIPLGEDIEKNSAELQELCIKYLGNSINYIAAYGIPALKADEMLAGMDYDLLIAGSHSRHDLGSRLVGSFAEHLLRNSTKPILIIP